MKKLADLGRISDKEYHALKSVVDKLTPNEIFMIEDVELLPGCVPSRATAGVYRGSGFFAYGIRLDRVVRYSGDNLAMHVISDGDTADFKNFDMLVEFFRDLSEKPMPTPKNGGTTPTSKPHPNCAANMDELVIPQKAERVVLDCAVVRRELETDIMGQEKAVETVAQGLALHGNKTNPSKPSSYLFYGSPGTGKTAMAKAISKVMTKLTGRTYAVVLIDLNQYTEPHSTYRLNGAPPGYLGYDDAPVFEAVVNNPYTVFIFDELDKAHPEVLKTFMAILDEGRCSARKELANGSREYDFKNCIFIFTSNYRLGESSKRRIGFGFSNAVTGVCYTDDGVDVSYPEAETDDETASVTKRIYRETEAARKAFIETGVLREIASRFQYFVGFEELSDEAKVKILVKQIVETGFEYGIRITHIASPILQALIDASMSEDALTVRSFKAVIEGYLATVFAKAGANHSGQTVRLDGTIEVPVITPV